MAYIGNNLTVQQYSPTVTYFSGNGSTTAFTLPIAVVSAAQILVTVANVVQNPSSAFTVSGSTLTFTSAPPSGTNNIWVEYTSLITTYAAISQNPSVIGDITASGGYLANGNFGNTFVDGTIVDYVTGNGRITTGPADGFTIYNGGPSARSSLLALNASGALGVGASPSYGTAGQILQSNGTGAAPTWVNAPYSADYLVIAGGGAGAADGSTNVGNGGGGAGGFVSSSFAVNAGTVYTITIGGGGAGAGSGVNRVSGANSSLTGGSISVSAIGGGGGGYYANEAGANGGSGGGGGASSGSAGSGTSGQGNAGAGASGSGGGGGGGAGAAASGQNGGNGSTWLNGTTYAGGGGGSGATSNGTGGTGGGGTGGRGNGTTSGTSGTANTGSGGGGQINSGATSGSGGSGVVIIRYAGTIQRGTGGTVTTAGGYTYHTFTTSGTYTG